ncbi:MAG TPA: DUF4232 domain-containing protein [Oryzihumus sp.]|nr:DUF4232 domain-containing protein [Oryzihumus sp.]
MRRPLLALGGAAALFALAGCGTTTTPQAAPPPSSSTTAAPSSPSPAATGASSPDGPLTNAPGPATPTGAAPCTTAQLRLVAGRVEGTAGSFYATFLLRNGGAHPCSLRGYPGFALLSADGAVIQHPATRTGQPYRTVLVRPGQAGVFVVRTVDATIPGTGCDPGWKTATVQVYPPGQRSPLRQPSHLQACNLTVGPVTASGPAG